nr:hypothetical protein [bacterium]
MMAAMLEKLRNKWAKLAVRQKIAVAVAAAGVLILACSLALPGAGANTPHAFIEGEEQRLARTLSAIKGAGKVEVMITYDSVLVSSSGGISSGDGASATPVPGGIRGVIVIAEGAGDLAVLAKLQRAVETVLQVRPDQVDIFVMSDK